MSIVMEINPFDFFTDTAGDALDAGFIYIGQPNKDPRQYPVTAYYDAALTIPAAMPLRTSNGYIVRNGSPTFLYINGNYSIRVESKTHSLVYYVADFLVIGNGSAVSTGDLANSSDPNKGAGMIGFKRSEVAGAAQTIGAWISSRSVSAEEHSDVITDKPDPDDYHTWDWQPAIQAALAWGLPVSLPLGIIITKSPILYKKGDAFFGAGMINTTVDYQGPAGTFAFECDFTGDGSDEWPGRCVFYGFTIKGAGGLLGAGATVGGIKCADDTSTLVNIPWFSFRHIQFLGLNFGAQVEGYAHIFEDCIATQCLVGYDLTHPEQGALHDCWANYCDIGVAINKRKLKFGHRLLITGGAYQRCNVGIDAWNFAELEVNTYFELNNWADMRIGDPSDGSNYDKGCKDVKFNINTTGVTNLTSPACIHVYATVGLYGDFINAIADSGRSQPNVFCNGFTKQIEIKYNPEKVHSSNPWVFEGDSILKSIARVDGGGEELKTLSPIAPFVIADAVPITYAKTDMFNVSLNGAVRSPASGATSDIATLPIGHRPQVAITVSCPVYDNGAGAWSSPTPIQIGTNGVIKMQVPANNRSVYLGGITFSIQPNVI